MYNILLVDDEIRTLDALEKRVPWAQCGIGQVYKARDFQEVQKAFNLHKIDLMICDIEMPNVSGIDTLARLRADGVTVPCIFLTCHAEFEYMRKAMQLSSSDYLLKPVNYKELASVINNLTRQMDHINQIEKDTIQPAEVWKKMDRNVEAEVRHYIRSHMMDDITVTDVANELYFNAQYLMRIFKNKTGYCLMEFITRERMLEAKKILSETSLPVKVVASMVGYADHAHFTRVFGKEFGISPTKLRQKAQI